MRGHKVVLRPVERADHALLQEWQNDAEVAYWMDYRVPFSLEDIAEDQARAREEGRPFIIELDGRAVGKCGLNQLRWEPRVCALYIYIGVRELWGQGLGRDAVMAVLSYAFDVMGMERVELSMLADNSRARRVYESCGFAFEGRLTGRAYRDGRWHDTAIMSVSRDAYATVRSDYGS